MTRLGELRVASVQYLTLMTLDQGSEFVAHARNSSRVRNNYTVLLHPLTFPSSIELLTCELVAFSDVVCAALKCVSTTSQQFNEIMPAIYSRFMDKDAREWRQIYKVSESLACQGTISHWFRPFNC